MELGEGNKRLEIWSVCFYWFGQVLSCSGLSFPTERAISHGNQEPGGLKQTGGVQISALPLTSCVTLGT